MKKKLAGVLYWAVQYTFGLPQNIAGGLMTAFLRLRDRNARREPFRHAAVTSWKKDGSMALGGYLFAGSNADESVLVHEYGHTLQSLVLGPVYLFAIGLPSVIWANAPAAARYRAKKRVRYTSFYPERWASAFGEKVTGKKAYRK